MSDPFWEERPGDWNSIMIGTGVFYIFADTKVDITGDVSNKWDVKEAPGTDGARETYRGYSPATPEVSWQIYTKDHWGDWQALYEEIRPRPGKKGPSPVEIVHPRLSSMKLRKFWVQSIAIPKQVGPDIFEVSIKCLEWFAKPKTSKPQKTAADINSVPVAGNQTFIGPPLPPKPSAALKP